jgi:KDO2-lipid IV(A) lauroyltransferase
MAKPRNDWVDRLQYLAMRLAAMAMQTWPVELCLAGARLVGWILYRVDRRHRERAIGNLTRSFPEKSPGEISLIALESMQHMCMLAVEVIFTPRLIRLETITRHIELENFNDALRLLMLRDHGLLLLTGHYGNWEVLGYALATLGFQTTSIARPLDNRHINDWLLGVRERRGQRILSKHGAVDEVTRLLNNRDAVGFIADQNAGPKGLFVDFFGRKASTYKSIGLLALRFNVPVVIGYSRRVRGQPFRFRLGVQDIIHPRDWEPQPDPLRYVTQRYTTAIENIVRADPAQYLWVHRRWKSRPKGEAPEAFD